MSVFRSLCVLCLAACAAFGQTAQGPTQPIPFSHKLHIGEVKLTCTDCHTYPAKFGDSIGTPGAPKCLECHAFSTRQTTTLANLNGYVAKNQTVPIFALRDFVFFDHRYHLMNGATCEGCHGDVGSQDVLADTLGTTKMTFCQPCHVKSGAKAGCNTCHDPR